MVGAATAEQIFIVYGCLSLAFGFMLGMPLSSARMQAPVASRHLVTAHTAAIMQGAVHLGLAVAVHLSDLASALESTAALLMATGSALFVGGATLNWRQGVGDHFAERSAGWRLLAISSAGHLGGLAIVVAGVLLAL
jgi:hypothetical protein